MIRKIAVFTLVLLALGIFNLNQNIKTDAQLEVVPVNVSSSVELLESLVATSAFAGCAQQCGNNKGNTDAYPCTGKSNGIMYCCGYCPNKNGQCPTDMATCQCS